MFQRVPFVCNNVAYLVSGTSECITECLLYTYVYKTVKTHLCNHGMGISIQFYYSPYRITNVRANYLKADQSNINNLEMSPKFIKLKGVYEYFALWKMLGLFMSVNMNT